MIAKFVRWMWWFTLCTILAFDVSLINRGIIGVMGGKPFLQGIIETLEKETWQGFLLSILFASPFGVYLAYLIDKQVTKKNKKPSSSE